MGIRQKTKPKGARQNAAKYLACFLLFMLLFTMISRGIYAYRMPRIVPGQASLKSISRTLYAEGNVEAAKETAVVLTEGVRIREICVKTGEKTEPETALLYLDEEDLKDLSRKTEEEIQIAEALAASAAGSAGRLEQQYALAHLRERLAEYQKLLEDNGKITCGKEGYVTQILVKPGERTPDGAVLLLADFSSDALFRAELTPEQAEGIKAGDTVQLQFAGSGIREEACPVRSVGMTAEGTWEAVVSVTAGGLSPGESGTMEMTHTSGKYPCCVPLSALHSDGTTDYVLLIREIETILGTELSVVRKNVLVAEQNESTAALKDGALEADEQIVVSSDKDVEPGDKVRLYEEEDDRISS